MSTGFCIKCGTPLPEGAGFCPNCGATVVGSGVDPSGTAGAEQQPPARSMDTPAPKEPEQLEPPAPKEPAPQQPTQVEPPAVQAPASSGIPVLGASNSLWALGAVALVILLTIGAVVIPGAGKGEQETEAASGVATAEGEVFLEPADYTGGDTAFTPSVDTNTAPEPLQPAGPPDGGGTTGGASGGGTQIRSATGVAPGLYGGTQNESACDQAQLIRYLQNEPQKAAAWAAVQGITPRAIPDFIRSLTPVVLRADTRVTNHGYENGRATPFQTVLQAGTAVLVDDLGIPRVKCGCGNPLAPPIAQRGGVTYRGTPWRTFRPTNVIVIVNNTNVTVNTFVLVNLVDPGFFTRPVGAPPPGQPPADGVIVVDTFCDFYPEACGGPVLGTGDVQITLRWYSTADLDLAVLDPEGNTINYDAPKSPSKGRLDVDSNGSCQNLTRRPVENVFWPPGKGPLGTYTVRVSYYAECPGGTGTQNFELTALAGGQQVPISMQRVSVADGTATFEVIPVTEEDPAIRTYASATGSLRPGGATQGTFEVAALPSPGATPETGGEPTEGATCETLFPGSGGGVPQEGDPNYMSYTMCVNDPIAL